MLLVIWDSQVAWLEGKEVIWGYQNMCVLSGTCGLKKKGPGTSHKCTSWERGRLTETRADMGALSERSVLENNTGSIQ